MPEVAQEQDRLLRHDGDQVRPDVRRRESRQLPTADCDRAGVRHELQHRQEQGRLSCPGASDDGSGLAFGEAQVHCRERRPQPSAIGHLDFAEDETTSSPLVRGEGSQARSLGLLLRTGPVFAQTLDGHQLHLQIRVVHDQLLDDAHDALAVLDREADHRRALRAQEAEVLQDGLQPRIGVERVPDERHAKADPKSDALLGEGGTLETIERAHRRVEHEPGRCEGANRHLSADRLDHVLVHRGHTDEVDALQFPDRGAVVPRIELHAESDEWHEGQGNGVHGREHEAVAHEEEKCTEHDTDDVRDGLVHDVDVLGEAVQHSARRVRVPPPEGPRQRAEQSLREERACGAHAAEDLQGVAQEVRGGKACHEARIDHQHLVGARILGRGGESEEPAVHETRRDVLGRPISDPERAQVLEDHDRCQ
mmetsp:Transcript_80973/g.205772  ORF Transcript_80973/g.205772 Transcript_80973/m.205772 type:complete len:423 (-) Transcript_80973:376-1644(-)